MTEPEKTTDKPGGLRTARSQKCGGGILKFVRERTVTQGRRYKDADIVHYTDEQTRRIKGTRRQALTPEKIRRQNEKNRERYLRQLLNTNFIDGDFRIDLTYDEDHCPGSREAAKKDLSRYIERIRRLYKKRGAALKYIRVTGGGREKECGKGLTRLHHHLIVGADGNVSREEIENLWGKGRSDSRRLKADKDGFGALAMYLLRHKKDCEKNEPVYKPSQNLTPPIETRNDSKYSERTVRKLERAHREGTLKEEFEKLYRGWECVETRVSVSDVSGWLNFYAKLRRKE